MSFGHHEIHSYFSISKLTEQWFRYRPRNGLSTSRSTSLPHLVNIHHQYLNSILCFNTKFITSNSRSSVSTQTSHYRQSTSPTPSTSLAGALDSQLPFGQLSITMSSTESTTPEAASTTLPQCMLETCPLNEVGMVHSIGIYKHNGQDQTGFDILCKLISQFLFSSLGYFKHQLLMFPHWIITDFKPHSRKLQSSRFYLGCLGSLRSARSYDQEGIDERSERRCVEEGASRKH